MNFGMDYQGGGGGGYGGGGGGGGYGGGGGGGGFSQQQQNAAPNSGGRARRAYDEQCLIPVTIRMILAARPEKGDGGTGSMELEDGWVLSHIKMVAAVRGVDESSTNIVYTVEDGTGMMDIKQWVDENACTALTEIRQPTLQENIYIKIIGQVKSYEGKAMVVADSVRVLSSSNELTHHFLETVYSGERYKRKSTFAPSAMNPNMMMGSGVGFGVGGGGGGGVPLQASHNNPGGGSSSSLTEIVMNYIRDHGRRDEQTGVDVNHCIQELVAGGRHTEPQVRKAIDDLASEGHIYSTIDENHYQYAG